LLEGKSIPGIEFIPNRKEQHISNEKLPPFPVWIRGRFDPEAWVENTDRNLQIWDPTAPKQVISMEDTSTKIHGRPGSAGIYEGIVRRLDSPKEADKFNKGDILVTSTTNVGWTTLFSRAGAIITDIGAVLSHAAIVARELGIPAVVGCGNATIKLKTGDRVFVNGTKGEVILLDD
jgi:pyruvate,water dikinase